MLGIVLVALGVAAAAYLVLKRFYAPMALLMVGAALIVVMGFVTGEPVVTGKSATNTFTFDVVQVMTNLLKSRAAGLGMNIMVVAGFAAYMDRIGATSRSSTSARSRSKDPRPVRASRSPTSWAVAQRLHPVRDRSPDAPDGDALPALGLPRGVQILPPPRPSRPHRPSTSVPRPGIRSLRRSSPKSTSWSTSSTVSSRSRSSCSPLCAIAHAFLQRQFDIKDRALGLLDRRRLHGASRRSEGRRRPAHVSRLLRAPAASSRRAPLRLLEVRLRGKCAWSSSPRFSSAASRRSWSISLTRRTPKEVVADTKAIFEGMGKVFTSTVILIICAEVFAEGLKRTGGIDAILTWASQIERRGRRRHAPHDDRHHGGRLLRHRVGQRRLRVLALPAAVREVGRVENRSFWPPPCAARLRDRPLDVADLRRHDGGRGLGRDLPFELVRRTLP